MLPGKMNPWIGRFSVKGVKADSKDDFMICKLKARLNLHGVLNVEQGYYVEEQEVEEPVPEKEGEKNADAMETDDKAANGEAKPPAQKTRKVKKQVRKGDLPISSGTASLTDEIKNQYAEQEGQMISQDKLVADTEERKNELESEIYSTRNKVDEPYESNGYAEFCSEEEKAAIKDKCEKLEDWIYDDGDDATKAQYVAKLEELRATAGPVVQRFNDKRMEEEEARRKAAEEAAAAERAQDEAAKQAAEEQRAAAEAAKKLQEQNASKDEEMKDAPADAEGEKPANVEEAS
ncbi:hypothetical protein D0866_12752 [Hortaea werneckii]|uniref:Uncharacterized protein n=1 Tax=Hortaea werneckii TaxID=91943 RepID=A0A3M6ZWI1_HORWE|nr:hypothetical protein D0866_12752 [Hortaea werneckii]